MNMKTLIKKLLNESLLGEAAVSINQLPKDVALFVQVINDGYDLVLYSKMNDRIYGTISSNSMGKGIQDIGGVAADKGYGPLMYELLMSVIYPRVLMPSRDGDIRGEAFHVWEVFYTKRNDVVKNTLPIDNRYYNFSILTGENDKFNSLDEKQALYDDFVAEDNKNASVLAVFNTMYQGKEGIASELVNRGLEMIKNGIIDRRELDNKSEAFFSEKYD